MVATVPSRPAPEASSPERTLIVDSDWLTASAMRHTLEGGGHVVGDVVSTSDEALSSATREVPGLAVVKIPAVGWEDGVGLVRQLRSHFGVPSVVITDAEGLACVIGAAAAGIVVKPFHKSQLLSAVAVAQRRDDSCTFFASTDAHSDPVGPIFSLYNVATVCDRPALATPPPVELAKTQLAAEM